MLRIRPDEKRSFREYAILSFSMSLVAGAVNSSGLLAAGAMTSHMTGNITRVGEGLALHNSEWMAPGGFFLCFLLGAFSAGVLVRLAQPWIPQPVPAMLIVEALLLGAIALSAQTLAHPMAITQLLSFCMGWQNSLITSISGAVVRTTHVTGATTDLGIELANLLLPRAKAADSASTLSGVDVRSDLARAGIHFTLLVCFLLGATAGPLLFVRHGYAALMAPAAVLVLIVVADAAMRRFRPPTAP